MGCRNLLSGLNSNHCLETTIYTPLGVVNILNIGLQSPWPLTGVIRALRARNPKIVEKRGSRGTCDVGSQYEISTCTFGDRDYRGGQNVPNARGP